MTTPTSTDIKIEACDREAATSIRVSLYRAVPDMPSYPDNIVPELLARHRIAERERIVAWLREDAAKTLEDTRRLHAAHKLTYSQTMEWDSLITLKTGLADALERGDHITTGQEKGA